MNTSDSTPDFSWLNKKEDENANEEVSVPDALETNPQSDESSEEETQLEESHGDSVPEASSSEETDSESVLDDEDGGEEDREGISEDPTILMPGRQKQIAENDADDSDDPDDKTMVLPTETASDSGSPEETELSDPSAEDQEPAVDEPESPANPLDFAAAGAIASASVEASSSEEAAVQESDSDSDEKNESSVPESKPEKTTDSDKLNLKFILLASYASAITLIVIVMLMSSGSNVDPHQLESLPDVAPEPVDSITYVPVEAKLPPGHTLKVGEKQRFGNIEVEALRVVQEPLEFTHYDTTSKLKRDPTSPVYKLWLKFTNVSEDQEIAPLDGDLLLRWVVKTDQQKEYSNQYIYKSDAQSDNDVIATYRHSKTSDWDMKGQKLGTVLAPGESIETYVASIENVTISQDDSVNWRVQFRKGFSPSGNGVTTILDVNFAGAAVETGTAPEKTSEEKTAKT